MNLREAAKLAYEMKKPLQISDKGKALLLPLYKSGPIPMYIENPDGKITLAKGWQPSLDDLLREDWELCD